MMSPELSKLSCKNLLILSHCAILITKCKSGGDIKITLLKNLKRLRKKRVWSQTQHAGQIGSHLSHINRIKTEQH